jgi:hypothetical protein
MKLVQLKTIAASMAVLALASCTLGPDGIAKKYGLPPDPFGDVLLQVVDFSKANPSQAHANLIFTIKFSDPAWANYLGPNVFVTPPGWTSGSSLPDLGGVKDTNGTLIGVQGVWKDSTDVVTFGDYKLGYTIADSNTGSHTVYQDTFSAKGPDGKGEGTSYIATSSGAAKFSDVSDFHVTMYSDGLGITLTGGTLQIGRAHV